MQINGILINELEEIKNGCLTESAQFEGKTILLCGGSGFLGTYFKAYFLYLNKYVFSNPCTIIAVDNYVGRDKPKEIEDPQLINLEHDLTTPLGLKLANYKISFILNSSGCASPKNYFHHPVETMKVSTVATDLLLELAYWHKASILNFSSSEVLSEPDVVPTPETQIPKIHSLNPRAPYDVTKLYIETSSWVFREKYKVDAKVVRLFNAVGFFRQTDYRVFPNFITSILKKEPIKVFSPGSQSRTFCWVTDTIAGCIKVLISGKSPIYHIGNSNNEIGMLDLAYLFEKVCGTSGLTTLIPTNELYKHEPQRRCPSIELARKELGYEPKINLEEMIRRFHTFAKETYQY